MPAPTNTPCLPTAHPILCTLQIFYSIVAAQNFCQKISKLLSKLFGKYFPALTQQNRDLHALNDSGAIKGLDAREDGVYITYSPTGGADAVTKKLGSPTIKTKAVTGNGSFDAGGKVLFAGIQNAGLHIMTYAQKYGQGSHYSATCSYAGNMITYDQHAYGENTSGTDQYSMTIIYAVE